MLWLTRSKDWYSLWHYLPVWNNRETRWTSGGRYKAPLVFPTRTFHRKYPDLKLPPGKDGICRVDMGLTRRSA